MAASFPSRFLVAFALLLVFTLPALAEDEKREARDVWPDVANAWLEIETQAKSMETVEDMENLVRLVETVQAGVAEMMATLPWPENETMMIQTGERFLAPKMERLRLAAAGKIPGEVRLRLPEARHILYVFQERFPEGYLPEPELPPPPGKKGDQRAAASEGEADGGS